MKNIEIGPIRPPSESNSLLVRVTRGCHWNKCYFCGLYKGGFQISKKHYRIKVNEKTKKFYAGEDGCWGSYTELYRKENGERLTDAVIVFLCMPDEMKFQEMEAVMGELFEKLPVIDKEKKETGQEPKRTR